MSAEASERPHAFRILRFDTLPSTNDEAMARLRGGDPGSFAVIARSQTRGRGRQGRAWVSPSGNLYASIGLRDPAAPADAPQLGFVAGVALIEALHAIAPGIEPKLKWPNDILLGGGKLAGMLLEATILSDGSLACVIGVGVNCASRPSDLPYPAADLRACGHVDPETLLTAFLRCFARRLGEWDRGRGFARIRSLWLRSAAGIGLSIEARTPRRILAGTFRDIDAAGRLMLQTVEGLISVEAGDVFFPAAMADIRD